VNIEAELGLLPVSNESQLGQTVCTDFGSTCSRLYQSITWVIHSVAFLRLQALSIVH
jgi:hypothetical protein